MSENDKQLSQPTAPLPDRALGLAADEFSKSSSGAGVVVGIAAKEAAEALLTCAKATRAILSPLKLVVWGYEQVEEKLIPLVAKKLAHVPEDRRISPDAMIAGPAIEGAKFVVQEEELANLFAGLLVTSMDSQNAEKTHPAFAELIKQLSPDEARILKFMAQDPGRSHPLIDIKVFTDPKAPGFKIAMTNVTNLATSANVEKPALTQSNIVNLCRLGLCEIPSGMELTDGKKYEELINHDEIVAFKASHEKIGSRVEFEKRIFQLTMLGRRFVDVCI